MREYWDLYDHARKPLGRIHQRGLPLGEGEYHVVVSVWTVNQDGKILITLRSEEKELFPGHWENTAGSVMRGETSLDAALRELREETGIEASPEEITCLGTVLKVASFVDIFLVRKMLDPDSIQLQKGETTAYRWVSYDELKEMDRQGKLAFPLFSPFQMAMENEC
ncbi:NUDIX domain-containing protein [uncultured Sphaerochaeta sp.]|uniref:NUDIX hydrolase n=1 Tax=uncultured Sphaerochaeta sp. TaxID=886478 RepID=UPI0029CA9F61|nr:NUDIX domain-containing protein [uncultured Sphaerochaeta sp.]